MNKLAPIVLFVYNRPWHTERTLNALMQNELAEESLLYIYADGPKDGENAEEMEKISAVEKLICSKKWCKEIHIVKSSVNKGLANSIMHGVQDVIDEWGSVIVLEDDLVTSTGFLRYMNDALNMYQKEKRVFHISGYMFPVQGELPNTFFYRQTSCWGWATWKDRWSLLNPIASDLLKQLKNSGKINESDIDGTGQFLSQLNDNIFGKIKTWAVLWHFSVFLKGGLSLHPCRSLVLNIGNDGTGTNSEANVMFSTKPAAKIDLKQTLVEDYVPVYTLLKEFYRPKKKRDLKNTILKSIKLAIPPSVLSSIKSNMTTKGRKEQKFRKFVESIPRYQHAEIEFLNRVLKIVDIASFQFIKKEIFDQQIYKFSTLNIKPYIIDCGANIGLSVIYFKNLYPQAEVLALEPDKIVFEVLEQNIKSFELQNVTALRKACWNEETTLRFFSEGADGGRAAQEFDNENVVEVEAIKLRKFLDRRVDFLKIDIEGAENKVVRDIADLLPNVDRIFVEYHSFVGQEQFLPELLSILTSADFRLNIHHIGTYSPQPFEFINEYNNMDLQLNIFGYRI